MAKVTTARKLISNLTIPVVMSTVMGVRVVRGYARICDLADVSKPDIYDASSNPTGTQRDLSPKHARDAYEYLKSEDIGFFPEVFLALRDSTSAVVRVTNEARGYATLELAKASIRRSEEIKISRVDGNHRLHFADGHAEGFPDGILGNRAS